MSDWNAALYNQYGKERIQPSIDLAARIEGVPERVMDLGCGSGLSTIVLRNRWENAQIVGLDFSDTMLQQAECAIQGVQFIKKDCNESFSEFEPFDCIFSNAALQWLKNQKQVIKNCSDALKQGGILAVQIPMFDEMPACDCIKKTADTYDSGTFGGCREENCINGSPEFYYNATSEYFESVTMWKTDYYHVFSEQKDIVNFLKSTALRPYLNVLDEGGKADFLERMLSEIKKVYPVMPDGKVLFPFQRLFLIAVK